MTINGYDWISGAALIGMIVDLGIELFCELFHEGFDQLLCMNFIKQRSVVSIVYTEQSVQNNIKQLIICLRL